MLRPTDTSPGDWYLLCTRPRQVVFPTLLRLKHCSPYGGCSAGAPIMNRDEWEAWVDDVLWVLSQVIQL